MPIKFLSLFSGIESASCAWLPLGWECVGFSEIEPFCVAVLKHHYPNVPNLGDITKITKSQVSALGKIDLVVFGWPCQDHSVAGNRKGLMHENKKTRSGLFFDAMRIVRWSGARYAVAENVPGLFTSSGGDDFATVVREILGVEFSKPTDGWRNCGVAASKVALLEWATLDAQYFGLAQRRQRVFFIADFGDWTRREPLFSLRESLCWYPPPSREARQDVAPTTCPSLTGSGRGVERAGESRSQDPVVIAECLTADYAKYGGAGGGNDSRPHNLVLENGGGIGHCLSSHGGRFDYETETMVTHSLRADGHDASEDGTGRGTPIVPMAFQTRIARNGSGQPKEIVDALKSSSTGSSDAAPCLAGAFGVRRLMPIECERLQGFPDNYSLVPYRGKPAADSPRYKAIGNSMAVPCMRWIGERIQMVEGIV
jgi:DNA (cytosine-5)-methyltransferase 1